MMKLAILKGKKKTVQNNWVVQKTTFIMGVLTPDAQMNARIEGSGRPWIWRIFSGIGNIGGTGIDRVWHPSCLVIVMDEWWSRAIYSPTVWCTKYLRVHIILGKPADPTCLSLWHWWCKQQYIFYVGEIFHYTILSSVISMWNFKLNLDFMDIFSIHWYCVVYA